MRRLPVTPAVIILIATLALVAHLSGCADTRRDAPVVLSTTDAGNARSLLPTFTIEPEHLGDYKREDWPHWQQGHRRCINVREEVLVRDSQEPVTFSVDQCAVISGIWVDAYTGETFTDPKQLDIDHVVALEEANQSGGWKWSREQRMTYANDYKYTPALKAVSATANRSKGSKGPEAWLPPNPSQVCAYVASWVFIKSRWQLSMDTAEMAAVRVQLERCP